MAENKKTTDKVNECPPINSWPLKLRQVPVGIPAFKDCELVIAADCAAFAHGAFAEFTRGRALLICCTKFDGVDYADKLSKIIARNDIRSIHVVRMEVPCCGGLVVTVRRAIELSGKEIPVDVSVISTTGKVNQ